MTAVYSRLVYFQLKLLFGRVLHAAILLWFCLLNVGGSFSVVCNCR